MSEYGVVLFYTTSAVMAAEKKLQKEGFSLKLVPTPRQFSSDCGISLRFDWEQNPHIEAALKKERIEYEAIRRL